MYYLARFTTSRENLRRVLMRTVNQSAHHHGTDPEAGADAVAALLDRLSAAGLLDDDAFAEARARTLRRRGVSERVIRARLMEKGIAEDRARAALDAVAPEAGGDVAAAARLARRRGLGPYRPEGDRADRRERDLAALARAGFTARTALAVIEAESVEALEALVAAEPA